MSTESCNATETNEPIDDRVLVHIELLLSDAIDAIKVIRDSRREAYSTPEYEATLVRILTTRITHALNTITSRKKS